MGIITTNAQALTTSTQIDSIKSKVSTWFATSTIFENCDTYVNDSVSLENNLVGEATLTGKRGGANRIRIYINKLKDTSILDVSIRYGNNVPYHAEVLTGSHDMSKRIQDIAVDGTTESRIRLMSTRFNEWLRTVSAIANTDELKKAESAESVTA